MESGDKSVLFEELEKETKRIKLALREAGYYAYKVVFINGASTIHIEAREWDSDCQELIDKT